MAKESQAEPTTDNTPEKMLVHWQGPDRPFKKRGIQFYFNVAAITLVIFLVLFFFVQYALIAVVFALVFVGIAINTMPPQQIAYKITSKGLYRGEDFARWSELKNFYLESVYNHEVILVSWSKKFPPQFVMLPDPAKKESIIAALKSHIAQVDRPKKGWYEKRADDLVKLVNLGQNKS